ncbi:WD40 repeat domain-containing protein [Candidatus Woesearchaeota archaeon]|nr:WD40 repeat domain-containing protein [Candidatus Woesearchaeota archaeon]
MPDEFRIVHPEQRKKRGVLPALLLGGAAALLAAGGYVAGRSIAQGTPPLESSPVLVAPHTPRPSLAPSATPAPTESSQAGVPAAQSTSTPEFREVETRRLTSVLGLELAPAISGGSAAFYHTTVEQVVRYGVVQQDPTGLLGFILGNKQPVYTVGTVDLADGTTGALLGNTFPIPGIDTIVERMFSGAMSLGDFSAEFPAGASYSPDGSHLFFVAGGKPALVDFAAGTAAAIAPEGDVASAAWSPDGALALAMDGTVSIYNLEGQTLTLIAPGEDAQWLDADRLILASNGELFLYDGQLTLLGSGMSPAVSSSGTLAYFVPRDGLHELRLAEIRDGALVNDRAYLQNVLRPVARFSPDGRVLAVPGNQGSIELYAAGAHLGSVPATDGALVGDFAWASNSAIVSEMHTLDSAALERLLAAKDNPSAALSDIDAALQDTNNILQVDLYISTLDYTLP